MLVRYALAHRRFCLFLAQRSRFGGFACACPLHAWTSAVSFILALLSGIGGFAYACPLCAQTLAVSLILAQRRRLAVSLMPARYAFEYWQFCIIKERSAAAVA